MTTKQRKSQTLLNGAMILSIATMIVKVIGVVYKIPLSNMIGTVGRGLFDSAYSLYVPVYTVATAGLPVAVSKMVSQQIALGRFRDVKQINKVAKRLFLIMGIFGTLTMLILAYPYASIAKTPNALPAILVITPSIFFCCLMSSYRGYYNGLRNMTPTAISQVFEAGGKLIFGLVCAKLVISYGMSRFSQGLTVYGKVAETETDALSAIYPYAAAAAAVGVTLGTVVGTVYLIILHKIKGDSITKTELSSSPVPEKANIIAKKLIAFAIPVVASSLVFSITNIIDAVTVQNRLEHVIVNNLDYIKSIYGNIIQGVKDEDIKTFLYGAYSLSLDFRNLIPSITIPLGVSAIPALSAAWATKNKSQIKISIESVLRVTMLIAMPCGIGMGVLAQPILAVFYGGGEAASGIAVAAPVLKAYGFTTFLIALSQPMTNMLQALDKTKIPLVSMTIGALVKLLSNMIFVSIPSLNVNGAIVGTVSCYLVITIINIFAIIKTTKIKIDFLSVFVKPVICGALCGVGAYCAFGIFNSLLPGVSTLRNIMVLGVSIGFGALIYVISILLAKGLVKDDINMLPKGEKIVKILAKFGFIG